MIRRIGFLMAAAVFLVSGCTTIREKTRMSEFEKVAKAYERVMLDSDFEMVHGFTDPRIVPRQTDFTAYQDVRIVEYQVKNGRLSPDNNELSQTVKLKYYRSDSLIVRTLRYVQSWKYDDAQRTWLLQTGLPVFE